MILKEILGVCLCRWVLLSDLLMLIVRCWVWVCVGFLLSEVGSLVLWFLGEIMVDFVFFFVVWLSI